MFYSVSLPYVNDASGYFSAIADLPWAAWLDSAGRGRYDILCAQPFVSLLTRGETTRVQDEGGVQCLAGDPFDLLRQQLGNWREQIADVPFAGGALGYWGYDLARCYGTLPVQPPAEVPEMAVAIYDWALVIDHQAKTCKLVSLKRHKATEAMLPDILARLQRGSTNEAAKFEVLGKIVSIPDGDDYRKAFEKVQGYLHAGDCYQVNLARRFTAQASGSALAAYHELRRLSPAPYSAFLDFPGIQVLSASPECFLKVRNGTVETRPIKGTRPRMKDEQQDEQMVRDLREHAKDRAENLMIVDLLRNDLGKGCMPGSIRVTRLFEVESYATVHHLVSTVTGRLAAGRDALTVMRDCFPGGSITGAPKQRAMEIIAELEPGQRGVYCGAIGYVGFDGSMDTNIAIRTMTYAEGKICFWAGGGIVADSGMASEYQETGDKARAMLEMLQHFGGSL